ncbi:MAG: hypothetical protein ABI639_02350 [Thermoanaerobaculia bacterium]
MANLEPPRCLRSVVARAVADPGLELDAVVDEWTSVFYALACSCGSSRFAVRSFIYREEFLEQDRAYGPMAIACAECDRKSEIFDPERHGFDVEIDHFPKPGPYRGTLREFACASCSGKTFALVARFQYPDEVLNPLRGPAGFNAAREDLFSYFSLLGTCGACEAGVTIASIECS